MNTWKISWRLVGLFPGMYAVTAAIWIGVHLLPLLPGLVIKRIFDILTQDAGLDRSFWVLIALLVGIGVGRFIWLMMSLLPYIPFRARMDGTLRLNMMDAVLNKPGAAALPSSPQRSTRRLSRAGWQRCKARKARSGGTTQSSAHEPSRKAAGCRP